MHIYRNYYQKNYFFSLSYIKNGEKDHRFWSKKDHKNKILER